MISWCYKLDRYRRYSVYSIIADRYTYLLYVGNNIYRESKNIHLSLHLVKLTKQKQILSCLVIRKQIKFNIQYQWPEWFRIIEKQR